MGGAVLFNRMVSRAKLKAVLREQEPCIVAMAACATSHFWGRFAQNLGHEVRLIPPICVKPFVNLTKNLTVRVHDAKTGAFQGYIDVSILVHGCSSMMLGAGPP